MTPRFVHIEPDQFIVGDFVFAKLDDEPQLVHKKDSTSYMVMRGEDKNIPQWLSFEDTLSSTQVAQNFPQYAYLYQMVPFVEIQDKLPLK